MKISRNQEISGVKKGNYLDYEYFLKHINDNRIFENNKKRALLNLIRQVIEKQLSPQQRACVMAVKIKGQTQVATAKQLGLNPSTVCRHLQAAEKHFDLAFQHFKTIEHSILTDD